MSSEVSAQTSEAEEWMPAAAAVRKLEAQYGGSIAAKNELADRLRDGRLQARAKLIWVSDREGPVYFAWKDDPQTCSTEDIKRESVIRPSIWRHSDLWSQDRDDWRWPSGRFALTHNLDPIKRVMLEGVSFRKDQINELVKQKTVSDKPRGPSADEVRWERFWMSALKLAARGQLRRGKVNGVGHLHDLIFKEMEGTGYTRNHVRGQIRSIMEKIVKIEHDDPE